MADRLDVAGRLAEGRPAVEHTQRYVRACQALGYEHPDLTAQPSQLRDWYESEEGLDLHALDGDCAELRAAADTVTEALRMQRAQVAELEAAWTGSGADSAVRFLQRHYDAANTVATEVRAAAQRCESLRDNLWHLLDVKVATVIAIDDRTAAQRPAWLAAADTLTTGAGDRPTAEELVDKQVKPYVDNDIRNDWLSAMRSTRAGAAASYDMVTDRMAAAPRAFFEIPGDLGPARPPRQPVPSAPAAAAAPAAVAPAPVAPAAAALPRPEAASAMTSTPSTTPMPLMSDPGTGLGEASALPTGAGDLGGGAGVLGALGGIASRIVEAMGDLVGSGAEQISDPVDDEDPTDEGEPEDAADPEPENAPEAKDPDTLKQADETEDAVHDLAVAPPPPLDGPPAAGPPAAGPPAAAPPVGEPRVDGPRVDGPPANPPPERSTPCEIAADELPQAGR